MLALRMLKLKYIVSKFHTTGINSESRVVMPLLKTLPVSYIRQLPLRWYFRVLPEAKTAASAVVILFSYGQNWKISVAANKNFS